MPKLTREQWMLAHSLAGVIQACNAPFCTSEDEKEAETTNNPDYVKNVAKELAGLCSRMMLEDVIAVLEEALKIHEQG